MTRARKTQRRDVDDPLLRDCPACGARKRQGCKLVGNDDKPIATKATRLVHAARLEGEHDA